MVPPKCRRRGRVWSVLAEVARERARQDEKWGEQNHPSGSPAPDGVSVDFHVSAIYEICSEIRAKFLCDTAAARGECTFAHIAIEELCEAVTAACDEASTLDVSYMDGPPEAKTRAELVQLAAVVVAWIEAIDRRSKS